MLTRSTLVRLKRFLDRSALRETLVYTLDPCLPRSSGRGFFLVENRPGLIATVATGVWFVHQPRIRLIAPSFVTSVGHLNKNAPLWPTSSSSSISTAPSPT